MTMDILYKQRMILYLISPEPSFDGHNSRNSVKAVYNCNQIALLLFDLDPQSDLFVDGLQGL